MRAVLLVALVAATGCIITSDDTGAYCGDGHLDQGEACDDGNNRDGDGCSASCGLEVTPHTTTATWSLETVAGDHQPCPPGFDTALVLSWKVDGSGNPIGACAPGGPPSSTCYIDSFSCAAGSGVTGPIPDTQRYPDAAGGNQKFLTSVAIANQDGMSVYAQTLADLEDLTTANQVYPSDPTHEHGTIYTDGGRFSLRWSLVGSSGAPLTCSSARAGAVSLHSTLAGAADTAVTTFKCDDSIGITAGLAAGAYALSVVALDTSTPPRPLGVTTELSAQAIHAPGGCPASPGCVTDLGTLMLNVNGQ